MAAESNQKKLGRVRPPRVQITYDVEIGNATRKIDLPLVVGIMADVAGQPEEGKTTTLKERSFVDIDSETFDKVMMKIAPRLDFTVTDRIGADPTKTLRVQLSPKELKDFRPESVVSQVPELAKLFEARQRLNDLLAKLDGNEKLDSLLQDLAKDPKKQDALKSALNGGNNG
jgi:type VI secretion system protein ImpB